MYAFYYLPECREEALIHMLVMSPSIGIGFDSHTGYEPWYKLSSYQQSSYNLLDL